jgi:hypothetical protein
MEIDVGEEQRMAALLHVWFELLDLVVWIGLLVYVYINILL